MAVARSVDSVTIAQPSTVTGVVAFNSGITVVSGDTLLIALCEIDTSTPGTVTGTWDFGGSAQSMTLLGSLTVASPTPACIVMFGVVNPTPGQKEIRIAFSGVSTNANSYLAAISFTGTATTSVAAATEGFASNNGTSATLSVTTAVSIPATDMAVSWFMDGGVGFAAAPMTNGATQADGGKAIASDQNLANNVAAEYYQGAGSTITASAGTSGAASDVWGAMIVGIKAPGGGDTLGNSMQTLMMSRRRRDPAKTLVLPSRYRRFTRGFALAA